MSIVGVGGRGLVCWWPLRVRVVCAYATGILHSLQYFFIPSSSGGSAQVANRAADCWCPGSVVAVQFELAWNIWMMQARTIACQTWWHIGYMLPVHQDRWSAVGHQICAELARLDACWSSKECGSAF